MADALKSWPPQCLCRGLHTYMHLLRCIPSCYSSCSHCCAQCLFLSSYCELLELAAIFRYPCHIQPQCFQEGHQQAAILASLLAIYSCDYLFSSFVLFFCGVIRFEAFLCSRLVFRPIPTESSSLSLSRPVFVDVGLRSSGMTARDAGHVCLSAHSVTCVHICTHTQRERERVQ